MCRDVTTKIAGLDNEGWTEMNTIKCCNFLCSKTQWTALKDGELQWGLGPNNRYSSAVHTASTAKMADGSDKYVPVPILRMGPRAQLEGLRPQRHHQDGRPPVPFQHLDGRGFVDAVWRRVP